MSISVSWNLWTGWAARCAV